MFDKFSLKAKKTIKFPVVKRTFAKWTEMHPGVFSNEENMKLIDIATGKTFYTFLNEELDHEHSNLAIGCLIPSTETHEFFMLIQLPGLYLGKILDIVEEKIPGDLTIKEVIPQI